MYTSLCKCKKPFPLTEVAEKSFFISWVICRTTSEIREQMGNLFSVDPKQRCKKVCPLTNSKNNIRNAGEKKMFRS